MLLRTFSCCICHKNVMTTRKKRWERKLLLQRGHPVGSAVSYCPRNTIIKGRLQILKSREVLKNIPKTLFLKYI